MTRFILRIPIRLNAGRTTPCFVRGPASEYRFSNRSIDLICWGDPIPNAHFTDLMEQTPGIETILNNVYGHYYFVLTDNVKGQINIGTSLFNILPLYYAVYGEDLLFSGNVIDLAEHTGGHAVSKRFILEFVLFNYPLFNTSFYEGTELVPSNSYISVNDKGWAIKKHMHIEDLFSGSPEKTPISTDEIAGQFLLTTKKYLPDQPYFSSLTGGFDSRALLAASLFLSRKVTCYCFGTSDAADTKISSELARDTGIPFKMIRLDNDQYFSESFANGMAFVKNASGTASFARAHYLYSARQLAVDSDIIVTGNFGSEVIRTVNKSGLAFPDNLIGLFIAQDLRKAFAVIESGREFGLLRKEAFANEWNDLKEEILAKPVFQNKYQSLTRNQRFYVYVFEEVFRKYFGAEIVNQFYHLSNRTPFLDIDFIRAIMQTRLAGVNSRFFEDNPLKRFKGHMLYSTIIRKAYPLLGEATTDKGHRPDDLATLWGKINILKGYLRKKAISRPVFTDPNSVSACFIHNREHFSRIKISPELFNSDRIVIGPTLLQDNEAVFRILSLSSLL
jgi:asparagine synthase (glutamine-hydrolysing)